jgi:hypothetical protein
MPTECIATQYNTCNLALDNGVCVIDNTVTSSLIHRHMYLHLLDCSSERVMYRLNDCCSLLSGFQHGGMLHTAVNQSLG